LELIVDPSLLENEVIFFNAARLDRSMVLRVKDYVEVAKPRLARIAAGARTKSEEAAATSSYATPLCLKGGGTHLGYQTHYVVDGGKRRIILGVLVTPGEVMENQPMLDLAWHVRFRWKLHPRQVTGDTKYGTEENIRGAEDMGIRAYMPLPDWEQNSPYFGASKFTYDAEPGPLCVPQWPGAAPHAYLRGNAAHPIPGPCLHLPRMSSPSTVHTR